MARIAGLLAVFATIAVASSTWADDPSATGQLLRGGAVAETSTPIATDADLDFAFTQETFSSRNPGGNAALPESAVATKLPSSIPLAARATTKPATSEKSAVSKPIDSLITVAGSLCVVLSIFFGLAYLTRRGLPKGHTKLPGEVIEVLGKAPLVKGQEMQLVRIGSKLLLICVTPSGCETLTEITDDAEVERLSANCRRSNPASVSAAFNQVLHGLGREPASGFTGTQRTTADRRGGRYG